VNPGGIRLGTPALTTRGFKEAEMDRIAGWCVQAIAISKRIQEKSGKKLTDFVEAIHTDAQIKELSEEIKQFARQYSMPGI
jgi:glycine hydroxymethyltransferase